MDILDKISLITEGFSSDDFSEGEYVEYKGKEYQVSHKDNGTIEIVSPDEKERVTVLASEIKKVRKEK